MTAFDKARKIVAGDYPDGSDTFHDDAQDVASALLAYEPTPDARDAAQKIAATAFARYGFPNEPQDILARDIASAITAAVAATEARVRELEAALKLISEYEAGGFSAHALGKAARRALGGAK